MDIIHLLPDAVANQIAAGEVIQRPASVIKELVENAIDAGATKIQVVVKNAGRTTIQVTDNGKGMSETDVRLAFERHATSKITTANDLFALRTMGFRGEALASIAAVADVEVRTCQTDADCGTFLEISASQVVAQEPIACQVGTSFIVKNLFFNIPARRKFLKSDETEMRQIIQEFQRIVLVYPQIYFTLHSGDDLIYDLPVGNSHQRINQVFGKRVRNLNQQLLQIEAQTTLGNISGFVGKPEFAMKNAYQYFFVNGRYMRHPYFHRAVMQAYERMLAPDENPSYFIFFDINPADIDVNIHPTKTEIKFENERDLWTILLTCVKESLGKFNVTPVLDFDNDTTLEIPVHTQTTVVTQPVVECQSGYNPFRNNSPSDYTRPKSDNWQNLYKVVEQKIEHEVVPQSQPLFEENGDTDIKDVMLYKNRFLLTPVKSGLMAIDFQRAMQRITYERILQQLEQQQCVSQRTLFPEILELSADDHVVFKQIESDLRALGFELEPFGKTSYAVNGVPALLIDEPDILALLNDMLVCAKDRSGNVRMELYEQLAFEVAKSSAHIQQKNATVATLTPLIDQLFACQSPNLTPDGKTVVSIITDNEIESRF